MEDTVKPGLRFSLLFEAEGRNESGYRTDITVHRRARQDESFFLPCDEGKVVGGEGTAPWPLCYFASGLTGCLSTHLRSFAKQLDIPLSKFSLTVKCSWEARQSGALPYKATPISFVVDIVLEGGASDRDKMRLIEAASQGCFVEQSLKPGLVVHRLKVGDGWVSV
jgi:uncharacterized OsmC-like protein